jgi:GNAT superfamily N-acetyltransferase
MAGGASKSMTQSLRIRSIAHGDLPDLTSLYRHLYPRYPIFAEALADDAFQQALEEPGVTILAGFLDEQLVSACTLVVIPNVTWAGKPTAMIENVVTHSDHRQNGFAERVVSCAIRLAWRVGCAKVLFLGGFDDPAVSGLCAATGFEMTSYGFELRRDTMRVLAQRHREGPAGIATTMHIASGLEADAGGVGVEGDHVEGEPADNRSWAVHA